MSLISTGVRNSQQNKSFARDKFSRSDFNKNLCFKRGQYEEEENHDDEEDSIAEDD